VTAALKFDVSPRAFSAALLATVFVLAAAMWFVVVGPKRSQASSLAAQVQAKQTQLATAEHQQSAKPVRPAAQLAPLQEALPDGLGMPQVVDQLNTLAVRSGVTLTSVKNTGGTPVPGTGYEAVPLTVVVDGRYFSIQRFLHLVRAQVVLGKGATVQAAGRLFDIQNVELDQTEPAPNVTATLALRAFYFSASATPVPTTPTTTPTDTTTTPSS